MSALDLARVRQELRGIDLALIRTEDALDLAHGRWRGNPITAGRLPLPLDGPRRYLHLGKRADPELVALADDVKALFTLTAIALGRVEQLEAKQRRLSHQEAS